MPYRSPVPLIFHWGGPRHGESAQVSAELLTSGVLVYDRPQWIGVYVRLDPPQVRDTTQGRVEVWVVRE